MRSIMDFLICVLTLYIMYNVLLAKIQPRYNALPKSSYLHCIVSTLFVIILSRNAFWTIAVTLFFVLEFLLYTTQV